VAIEWAVGYFVGMTRRRPILAACVAVVVLGAAWWLSADRLTADEQQIVGTWRYNDAETGEAKFRIVLTADRQFYDPEFPDRAPCWWHIQNGSIVFDYEPNPIRRALRPLAPMLRLGVGRRNQLSIEVTGDRMAVTPPNGTPTVWTRDRGD
jgi:hypothetical protein